MRRHLNDRLTHCNRDDDAAAGFASSTLVFSQLIQAAKRRPPSTTNKKEKEKNGKKNYREKTRRRTEEEKVAITVTAAQVPKMSGRQSSNVEETVPPDRCEELALGVANVMAAVMIVLGLASFISAVLRLFGLFDVSLAKRVIPNPGLVIGIPCAVFMVALCIKTWKAVSRIGVNGDCEDGGTAEVLDDFVEASHDRVLDGSDGDAGQGMVQPPKQTPPVVAIPSSSSSGSGGGVLAGSGVVTAAYAEPGGASHHRRGEREIDAHLSGEAVRDIGKEKNA